MIMVCCPSEAEAIEAIGNFRDLRRGSSAASVVCGCAAGDSIFAV